MMAFTSRQHHSTIMTMKGYTVFETVWLSLAVGQRLACIGPGKGPQGNSNSESSDCLQKHFIMPWILQNDICKASPLPSIGHPTGHKKSHKNAHVEKVLFLA